MPTAQPDFADEYVHELLRLTGTLTVQGQEGSATLWYAAPDRFRMDASVAGQGERVAYDGQVVRATDPQHPVHALEGTRAELARGDQLLARCGDWAAWHGTFDVVQRYHAEGMDMLLVRLGDPTTPSPTLMVEEATGRVVVQALISEVPGLGRVGQFTRFSDFRDVAGMLLPHRMTSQVTAMVRIETEVVVTEVALGEDLPEGFFRLED